MSEASKTGAPWTDRHTVALTRAIVVVVMANRTTFYTDTELLEVANNHGDRIRKKTHQILHKMTESVSGGEDIMSQELAKTAKTKSKGAAGQAKEFSRNTKRVKEERDDERMVKSKQRLVIEDRQR